MRQYKNITNVDFLKKLVKHNIYLSDRKDKRGEKAVFRYCDLTEVFLKIPPKLKLNFSNVEFISCKFVDVDFNLHDLSGVVFEKCEFYSCKLESVDISNVSVLDCKLFDTKLLNSSNNKIVLSNSEFINCNFKLNYFDDVKITECVFSDTSILCDPTQEYSKCSIDSQTTFKNCSISLVDKLDLTGVSQVDTLELSVSVVRQQLTEATKQVFYQKVYDLFESKLDSMIKDIPLYKLLKPILPILIIQTILSSEGLRSRLSEDNLKLVNDMCMYISSRKIMDVFDTLIVPNIATSFFSTTDPKHLLNF